jgi:hypothetical protein
MQRALAYTCVLGAAACFGGWLGGGSTEWATTGVILLVVAGTSWIAARVWENQRGD